MWSTGHPTSPKMIPNDPKPIIIILTFLLRGRTNSEAAQAQITGGMCQLVEATESPLFLQSPRTTQGPSRRPWMSPSTKRVIALALSSEVSRRVGCGEGEEGNGAVSEPLL